MDYVPWPWLVLGNIVDGICFATYWCKTRRLAFVDSTKRPRSNLKLIFLQAHAVFSSHAHGSKFCKCLCQYLLKTPSQGGMLYRSVLVRLQVTVQLTLKFKLHQVVQASYVK